MIRHPAVAGTFYPGGADALRRLIGKLLQPTESVTSVLGLMVPHAGYVYSGAIAGAVFSRVKIPGKVLLLGPNHHGHGRPAALWVGEAWRTPLGDVGIDRKLVEILLRGCPLLQEDEAAHRHEHSLEVQLPFLQVLAPQATIVPVSLALSRLEDLVALGQQIGRCIGECGEPVLFVASSDMSHYEPGSVAREKDLRALQHLFDLDPEGLYRTVRQERISMCGMIPTVVMLAAARELGARGGTLVRYGNSGEVTGDQSQVVGYAGVVINH